MATTLSIDDKSPDYDARINQWQKVRDAIEGEENIKAQEVKYLPKPKGQDNEQYKTYLERATFYGVTERTLRGLVGLVFRIDPIVELPDALEPLFEDATPDNQSLDTAMKDATREVLSLGRVGILVDLPREPSTTPLPYLAVYRAENVWRWEEAFDPNKGERMLTRLVVREDSANQGAEETNWLRELFIDEDGLYKQQLWRRTQAEGRRENLDAVQRRDEVVQGGDFEREGDEVVPRLNGQPLRRIPFWFVNTFDASARPSKPPMMDLVQMNLAHYRNSADLEQGLHMVGNPTPWAAANWEESEKPTHIGSGTMWLLSEGATVGMLEFSGAGLEAISGEMEKKEDRMGALGARLIRDQERSNVTAETTRLQSKGETSVLTSGVQQVSRGFKSALRFAAEWVRANPDDVSADLNEDFFDTALSPQELQSLVLGWQSGAYSRQTLHENLQRGEVIDPKVTLEEELERIEQEAPDMPPGAANAPLGGDDLPPSRAADLEAGGSIKASGATAAADGHAHAFELTVADDGTITGRALAQAPDGTELDHEHGVSRLDRTEEADGHAHGLPLSG